MTATIKVPTTTNARARFSLMVWKLLIGLFDTWQSGEQCLPCELGTAAVRSIVYTVFVSEDKQKNNKYNKQKTNKAKKNKTKTKTKTKNNKKTNTWTNTTKHKHKIKKHSHNQKKQKLKKNKQKKQTN